MSRWRNASQAPLAADTRLIQLVDELAERLQAGEDVDLHEFAERHPEYAERLHSLLPAIELMARLGDSLGSVLSRRRVERAPETGVLGDFRILREVGRGGMGVVYEAEQISLGRRVALKVLPYAGAVDARQLQRFRTEAQAAAQLHHTNIVPVFAVGCERGVHFYAMQFIDGQTLAEAIKGLRQLAGLDPVDPSLATAVRPELAGNLPTAVQAPAGPLSDLARAPASGSAQAAAKVPATLPTEVGPPNRAYFRAVAELGVQAARALDYAHQQALIHRDIKPANLLIDTRGTLWVADFGLARFQNDAGMTMTGDLVGTLRYMSPEQALAKRVIVDHRTDVYSLGVTLYELLTLHPAFDGDRQEVLRQIASVEPRSLRAWNKAIPRELETIVLKSMSKEPAARYATAQELADDLQRFLDERPIRARRPSLAQRAVKWSRRHSAIVATAMVFLLLGTITSSWQAIRATRASTLAARREREAKNAAAQSQAVLQFLVSDLLGASEPEKGLAPDVKVSEVLSKAEKRIDKAFPDEPLVEAGVRHAMAVAFHSLGRYEAARQHALRARNLRLRALGPAHAETLSSTNVLAELLLHLRKLQECQRLCAEAHETAGRALGPEHREVLRCANLLASALWLQGQSATALKLHERNLEIRRRILGPEDPATVDSMVNLARVLRGRGKLEEAGKLLSDAVEIRRRTAGLENADTASAIFELGVLLRERRKFEEARAQHEQSLEIRRRILGPEHPMTLASMHALAIALDDEGKHDQGRALLEETLLIERRLLGAEHPQTLNVANSLAALLKSQGKLEEARALHEQTLEAQRRVLGPENLQTLNSMHNLAGVLSDQGRCAEAARLLEQALEIERRTLGSNDPKTLRCMRSLAVALQSQGNLEAARTLLEQTLDVEQRTLGPEHRQTLNSQDALATVLADQGRFDEARRLCEQTLASQARVLGPDDPDTLGPMHNLANVLFRQGRLEAARKRHEQTLQRRRAVLGPEHPSTLASMQCLAAVLAALDKAGEARTLYEQTLAIERRTLGPEHPQTLSAAHGLANLLWDSGDFDEARTLHEQTLQVRRRVLGPEHPDTLSSLCGLANALAALGQCDEAGNLLEQVLEGQRRVLGGEHPETLLSMYRLACLLDRQGKPAQAGALLDQTIDAQQRVLGKDHPETRKSMSRRKALRGDQRNRHEAARPVSQSPAAGPSAKVAPPK